MNNISNLISILFNKKRRIDTSKLPSQGFFYKDNFDLFIRKASIHEIVDYEYEYDKENLSLIINKVKKIVRDCTTLSKGYEFDDIKALDVIYIFLEIVKFTNNSKITIPYFNDINGYNDNIEFDSKNFNYFNIGSELMKNYDVTKNEFKIDDYGFSLPSIGIENSISEYLMSKQSAADAVIYNEYNYDFIYFLGGKRRLTFRELDNLITIFNVDLEQNEQEKISKIVSKFAPIFRYTLKKGEKVIDLNAKLNLATIWSH